MKYWDFLSNLLVPVYIDKVGAPSWKGYSRYAYKEGRTHGSGFKGQLRFYFVVYAPHGHAKTGSPCYVEVGTMVGDKFIPIDPEFMQKFFAGTFVESGIVGRDGRTYIKCRTMPIVESKVVTDTPLGHLMSCLEHMAVAIEWNGKIPDFKSATHACNLFLIIRKFREMVNKSDSEERRASESISVLQGQLDNVEADIRRVYQEKENAISVLKKYDAYCGETEGC